MLDAVDTGNALDPVRRLAAHMAAHLIGGEALTERLLIGLLTGGHVLIEGAPGLGKTRAVKLLAGGLAAPFSRIQCTPDLMPADLTGAPVYRRDREAFEFVRGPLFASIVLVDEINRAPPKVQSALLEAMGERQVTSGGETHSLPDPFAVFATQNPIEHEGTFPLPEAQLDRFLLHVTLGAPDAQTEARILDLAEAENHGPVPACDPPLSPEDVVAAREAAGSVYLSPVLKDYIVRLVTATRRDSERVEHPVSPRGSIALARAAKVRAALDGRDHAVPEDVRALAVDALGHRLSLRWRAAAEGHTPRSVVADLLDSVPEA